MRVGASLDRLDSVGSWIKVVSTCTLFPQIVGQRLLLVRADLPLYCRSCWCLIESRRGVLF